MHSALRLRLKALAACWDFQFTQWFSPINPCAVFPSIQRAKIEDLSQTERLKCLSVIKLTLCWEENVMSIWKWRKTNLTAALMPDFCIGIRKTVQVNHFLLLVLPSKCCRWSLWDSVLRLFPHCTLNTAGCSLLQSRPVPTGPHYFCRRLYVLLYTLAFLSVEEMKVGWLP